MKKIYLKPEIESTVINTEWLMTPNGGGTTTGNTTPGNPDVNFSPKRKVF